MIAILCADIHLSHKPPRARAGELNWYDAMARPLLELQILSESTGSPIICAGDIFDKWNPPAELINFAIEHMPFMYAIPGNHDLPYHDYKQKEKTGYWTLVQAGKIHDIEPGDNHKIKKDLWVAGFPWGYDLCNFNEQGWNHGEIALAVVHKYVWIESCGHPGAQIDDMASRQRFNLKGFDAAVFGDNHKGFLAHYTKHSPQKMELMNCGTLMRRAIDEIAYAPRVGLLHKNGKISSHYLDTTKDRVSDKADGSSGDEEVDVRPFMKELQNLKLQSLNFADAIQRFIDATDLSQEARQILLEAIDDNGERPGNRGIR